MLFLAQTQMCKTLKEVKKLKKNSKNPIPFQEPQQKLRIRKCVSTYCMFRNNNPYAPLQNPNSPANHSRRPRKLKTVLFIFLALSLPLTFLILNQRKQSMRICLPFSLSRISSTAHRKLSCQYATARPPAKTVGEMSTNLTIENEGRLGGFLAGQRELFLTDVRSGKGRGWNVAMGNEAGGEYYVVMQLEDKLTVEDLDSVASSIAYSYLSSVLLANRSIPLVLTPSSLLHLRPENLLAFKLASIPPSALLHCETLDLPENITFTLVDHNKLLPPFTDKGKVSAVIDHHSDEGLYNDADVRVIQVPTGSCASLVTKQFKSQWEASLSGPAGNNGSPVAPELATLLLSAILIDTGGLKEGGKATPTDYDSAAFLYPLSSFCTGSEQFESTSLQASLPDGLTNAAQELISTKYDVAGMSTPDLLLRDYKEYTLPTASTSYPNLKVGLSTVPVSLRKALEEEQDGWTSYLSSVDSYMSDRNLDIEGVLTTYKSEKKGKNKREILLVVRSGGAIHGSEDAKRVLEYLGAGMEGDEILSLGIWDRKHWKKGLGELDNEEKGHFGKVWEQENVKATRKQVAPIIVSCEPSTAMYYADVTQRDLVAKMT